MSWLANYLVTLFILSGMIELLEKIVHGKEPSENPFPKLGDKVIEFLGLTDGPNIPCKERKGTQLLSIIILYLYLSPALGLIQGFLLTFFHKTSKVYFF